MSRLNSSTSHLAAVPTEDDGQITLDDAIAEMESPTVSAATRLTVVATASAAHPDRVPAMSSLTADFLEFHQNNPHVYIALRDLAREWKRRGKGKCGMSLLFGRVRWEMSLRIEGDGTFELNDHTAPFYSRALMHFEPELAGMFNVRRADEADAWIRGYQQQAVRNAQRAA